MPQLLEFWTSWLTEKGVSLTCTLVIGHTIYSEHVHCMYRAFIVYTLCTSTLHIHVHDVLYICRHEFTLDDRIEYLSRAVMCAKSCNLTTSASKEGEFLHELEEKMEVCFDIIHAVNDQGLYTCTCRVYWPGRRNTCITLGRACIH